MHWENHREGVAVCNADSTTDLYPDSGKTRDNSGHMRIESLFVAFFRDARFGMMDERNNNRIRQWEIVFKGMLR